MTSNLRSVLLTRALATAAGVMPGARACAHHNSINELAALVGCSSVWLLIKQTNVLLLRHGHRDSCAAPKQL